MRLIELMVVVTISLLLSAIAWINLQPLILRARTAADKHEMHLLVVALTMVETDTGAMTLTLGGLVPVYFRAGSNYHRDSKFRPYTYNRVTRKLCSVDNGCVDF